MLGGLWVYAASPAASVFAAFGVIVMLVNKGFHRDSKGILDRRRLASLVVLSASTYTFAVLVVSHLFVHGPILSVLVHDGFGDARVAWLLFGVALDGIFRVWDEFRQI